MTTAALEVGRGYSPYNHKNLHIMQCAHLDNMFHQIRVVLKGTNHVGRALNHAKLHMFCQVSYDVLEWLVQ